MMNYGKIKEKMLDEARVIDTGLYYTIVSEGLNMTWYCTKYDIEVADIEAIDAIIYNKEITRDDVKSAISAIINIDKQLNETKLHNDMDNIYKVVDDLNRLVEQGTLDNEDTQEIRNAAEKYGIVYLWYNHIFKFAKKLCINAEYGKDGGIEEIRKVAEKMSHDFLFLTKEQIVNKLIKMREHIRIDINMYNVNNDMITWYRSDNGYVVIVDDDREMTGIHMNSGKIMNDAECREFLCIESE